MAIGLLASVGISLVSSIFQGATSGVSSKGADVQQAETKSEPSFKVKLSEAMDAMKKNAGASSTTATKTPVDQLLSKSSDSVKKAWEKTREELGLDGENKSYYVNQLAMMSLMAEARLSGGIDSQGNMALNQADFFGSSTSSAIDAVDAVINRLNNPVPGYESPRDRQAALEMFSTFKQNLMNA
ncbi:hypothetical protein NB640_01625 [Oxalobacter vibrioformis]|uniref:Uncharacterized protein n=1 Tax=Oxalobacter vibrioformis TaxID=933080 RepID=A0A9E9P2X7_9BURK|nr:hypothetical protein [Oxalobacter vibrioformis]WAW10392.1 hypothetical protein NB640_01625 [Oxalobacter vibrioformis]